MLENARTALCRVAPLCVAGTPAAPPCPYSKRTVGVAPTVPPLLVRRSVYPRTAAAVNPLSLEPLRRRSPVNLEPARVGTAGAAPEPTKNNRKQPPPALPCPRHRPVTDPSRRSRSGRPRLTLSCYSGATQVPPAAAPRTLPEPLRRPSRANPRTMPRGCPEYQT